MFSIDQTTILLKKPTAPGTIFLDRDGVLNHVVLRGTEISSPRSVEEFRVVEDIDALADHDIIAHWNLVVITNQADLSRGWINMQLLKHIHDRIGERISLNAVYICPHLSSDNCSCRKPRCGLIDRFRNDHPHLARGREYFVGDRKSDQACAEAARIPFVLRLWHYNQALLKTTQFVVETLGDLKGVLKNGVTS